MSREHTAHVLVCTMHVIVLRRSRANAFNIMRLKHTNLVREKHVLNNGQGVCECKLQLSFSPETDTQFYSELRRECTAICEVHILSNLFLFRPKSNRFFEPIRKKRNIQAKKPNWKRS